MSRSLKKGPNTDERLLAKVAKLHPGDKTVVKTWNRSAVVTPEMIGYTFGVYNGKVHVPVTAVENMIGHKLGEFSHTRKFVRHGGKMTKDEGAKPAPAAAPAAKK